MSEINVKIDAEGNATITTRGFKGKACLEATKDLEEALGVKTKTTLTPEFRQQEVSNETVNRQRR